MSENKFLRLLCSIPICLLVLYFIPFLGVCLTLFRFYIYRNRKYYSTSVFIIVFGALLWIPKLIDFIIKTAKINVEIPYLNTILTSDLYPKFISYSKFLICFGVIILILSVIFRNAYNKLMNKLNSGVRNYIQQDMQKDYEIRKENDMKMQEKREIAKNTHVVKCPNCGSENMLTAQTGTCKFCRQHLEYKG